MTTKILKRSLARSYVWSMTGDRRVTLEKEESVSEAANGKGSRTEASKRYD